MNGGIIMKACIFTGHPSWKDGLNETTQKFWDDALSSMTDITDYSVYNVYGLNFKTMDELIGDADICVGLFLGPDINEDFFKRHPNLKYISTLSMGYGQFDKKIINQLGITVTNTLYGAQTIAQFSMALLMDICHNIGYNSSLLKNTDWNNVSYPSDIIDNTSRQIELYDKTIGIIGIGHVGLWLARMAHGFGMHVLGHSRTIKTGAEYDIIDQVSLDELYRRSDIISLNCSENPSSVGIINKESIAKMKDGVIIINDARGSLIVEEDLEKALYSGKVYAAGLDATSFDTKKKHIPLMDCPNTRITSHIAWFPMEARMRDIQIAAENLKNYLSGNPTSVIA